MTFYDVLAQVVGLLAMFFNIFSYQQKKSGTVIAFQFFGASLFAVNFLLIGGTIGAILNLIAAFRAIVFFYPERFRSKHVFWQFFFCILYFLSYYLTFSVFRTPWNLRNAILELLPVIGLVATTISFRFEKASVIRRFALISSPSWLIYNLFHFTLGGIICEVLSLVSVFVGMIRHDQVSKIKK